jgi:hypothetical protein
MILWFVIAQLLAALVARLLFKQRHYFWSRRHTLLSTVVPLGLFLVWACFWYLLPADILPGRWFDRSPTIGSLFFMCLPPFVISWFLFFGLSVSSRNARHQP